MRRILKFILSSSQFLIMNGLACRLAFDFLTQTIECGLLTFGKGTSTLLRLTNTSCW